MEDFRVEAGTQLPRVEMRTRLSIQERNKKIRHRDFRLAKLLLLNQLGPLPEGTDERKCIPTNLPTRGNPACRCFIASRRRTERSRMKAIAKTVSHEIDKRYYDANLKP
jgi:hypothetical protein